MWVSISFFVLRTDLNPSRVKFIAINSTELEFWIFSVLSFGSFVTFEAFFTFPSYYIYDRLDSFVDGEGNPTPEKSESQHYAENVRKKYASKPTRNAGCGKGGENVLVGVKRAFGDVVYSSERLNRYIYQKNKRNDRKNLFAVGEYWYQRLMENKYYRRE